MRVQEKWPNYGILRVTVVAVIKVQDDCSDCSQGLEQTVVAAAEMENREWYEYRGSKRVSNNKRVQHQMHAGVK